VFESAELLHSMLKDNIEDLGKINDNNIMLEKDKL
jgi:hypothetical protein